MKRLLALGFGALVGLVTIRLIRRRRKARAEDSEPTGESAEASDQAAALRRKLDEVREREGDTVGPARVDEDVAGEELEPDLTAKGAVAAGDAGNGATTHERPASGADAAPSATDSAPPSPAELSERRARAHGRAREAAESMRDGDASD